MICGRSTTHDGERYPLGRIRFPHVAPDDADVKIALGCQHCYIKQARCNYFSIDELRVARTTHVGRGRKPSSMQTIDKKPSASHVAPVPSDLVTRLSKLHQELGSIIREMKSVAPSTTKPSEPLEYGNDDFIDSILVGHELEIEQHARDAALKATLVPEEWWNDKTTRQILEISAEKLGQRYNPETGAFEAYDF